MKKVVLAFAVFIIPFIGHTQGVVDFSYGGGQKLSFQTKKTERESISGSPYISEAYLPVKLSILENENILVRYNAADDEMEFNKSGEVYYVPKSDDMKIKFLSSGKEYHYTPYNDKGELINGYLVLLAESEKISLYKKEQIKLIPAKETTNGYDSPKPAEYKKVNDTFFLELNGSIDNFPKNKKELLRKFSKNETEISEYLKKNKTSFSREVDLVELTKFS